MDLTEWLEYFSEGLAVQLREIKNLGKQAMKQSLLTKEYYLSERQRLAIDYMTTEDSLSIQQFEKMCPDVTRRTLQRELKDLIDKGLVMSSGATSNLIYQLKEK